MAPKKKSASSKPASVRVGMSGLEQSPEYYSDQFAAAVNPWGVMLMFAKLMVPEAPGSGRPLASEAQATIRMSLQHAKVMTMAMRRALKQWETDNVEITIAPVALDALDMTPADW